MNARHSKAVQMPEESVPGHFVWYDLMTTDPNAAVAFYTAVVGRNANG